jgi:4-hydroxybenzoyl-CoA thioesterase
MAFTVERAIRFADEDHARIVYYPRFFHFFHEAFEDMFAAQGVPYRQCLDEGVGWPAVHAEADYRKPVRFGDRLVVRVSVAKIGTTSATFHYSGTLAGDTEPAVTAKIVVACIDMQGMKAQPIPERYREMLERVGP